MNTRWIPAAAAVLICSVGAVEVQAQEETVQIKLSKYYKKASAIEITASSQVYAVEGKGILLLPQTTYRIQAEGGNVAFYENGRKVAESADRLTLKPQVEGKEHTIQIGSKKYLGEITFINEKGLIQPVIKMNLENYLKGVVSFEMSEGWGSKGGLEALKAQAVTARTYALRNKGTVMTDTDSHQVYGGVGNYPFVERAVDETKGKVLKNGNDFVHTFYSSSNGGKMFSIKNAWGTTNQPYLIAKDDPFDKRSESNDKNWTLSFEKTLISLTEAEIRSPQVWWSKKTEQSVYASFLQQVKTKLKAQNLIPAGHEVKFVSIPSIQFVTNPASSETVTGSFTFEYYAKTPNGFVMENGKLKKFTVTYTEKAYTIRGMIGGTTMKSPYIKAVTSNGTHHLVAGGGWGHNIGMSQYGALQMAKEGFKYHQILDHYYPGTNLSDLHSVDLQNFSLALSEQKTVDVQFDLAKPANVKVLVYDEHGNYMLSYLDQAEQPGRKKYQFATEELANGTYIIKTEISLGENGIQEREQPITLTHLKDPFVIEIPKSEHVYEKTDLSAQAIGMFQPMKLVAISQKEDWFKVKTSWGMKWIKPAQPMIVKKQEIDINGYLYVYESPQENAQIEELLSPQRVVSISQVSGTGWHKIQLSGKEKWINLSDGVMPSLPPYLVKMETVKGIGTDSEAIVKKMNKESRLFLTVHRKKGDWYLVDTPDGQKWINATEKENKVVQELQKQKEK